MNSLTTKQIQEIIPHRHPFLLVDYIEDFEPGEFGIGYKCVTYREDFFAGHFPQEPVMPGVLIIEALAQATGLLAGRSVEGLMGKGRTYYLVGLDKVRFKRPVVPGDQLRLEARYLRHKRNIWAFECRAEVEGELVASAEIMCAAAE